MMSLLEWGGHFGGEVEHAVSGPDLLIALVAISTLTESAGFGYLCLPSDRAEVRLASMTKAALFGALIEPYQYEEWYRQLPATEKTPQRKLLVGLLYPRDGLGGWFVLTPVDFDEAIGPDMWLRFSRYVDNHLDDAWVRLCMISLATGVVMGIACLFYRYFGINISTFHPTEFGTIILLMLLNFSTAAILISLAFGLHHGEVKVLAAIKRAVTEVKPHLERWNQSRMQGDLARLGREVDSRETGAPPRPRPRHP